MANSTLKSKEITTAQVDAVSFGFFSDEEVRKLSVKQVTSPIIFDNLKSAVKGGLYDPAFGPMDIRERCATCGLSNFECPGHFGHIELAVPIYNPLVFTQLYKLLRCTCLHCFKLKMSGVEVERFRRRFELLSQGRLVEAQSMVVGTSAGAKKAGGDLIDDAIDMADAEMYEVAAGTGDKGAAAKAAKKSSPMDYDVGDALRRQARRGSAGASGAGPRAPGRMSAQTLEAMIDAIGEFFRRQPAAGKCQNCGCNNPNIKKEGYSKLFMMPLPPKKRAANQAQGTPILPVLQRHAAAAQEVEALEAELAAGLLQQQKAGGRKRRREGEDDGDEAGSEDGEDAKADGFGGDFKDDDESDEKDGAKGEGADALLGADVAGAAGGKQAKAGRAAALRAALEGVAANENPKYLSPAEVREVMCRMWELNEPLLQYIYPTEVARRQRRRGAGLQYAAAAGNAAAKRCQGYQEFFLQTVPVAPNRFRPANHVGEAVYEHPQNTLLMKALNANLDLVAATKHSAGSAAGKDGDSPEAQAQAQLGRTLRHWQELQNAVNALFDTSSAQDSFGVTGIRQQLEKKEGLFRKNMMGKRVNFAARSVISPDVYLNGGEIGVPPYFASRLSYPERVTPWNLEKLRAAVVAGPGRNPGAVAVEDERGRMVLLRKDRKSREAVARTLGAGIGTSSATPGKARTTGTAGGGGKIVYRTMEDGDFMLTNRQPTLHKPGMMGHRARVLKAERTIRFHYANCSTFNADFDGDEINLHLPQDHLGRAEGYNIVHADEQFFVPTDGKPLRGLIQDHIVGATLLTMRDRFVTQQEYCQLVYECIAPDCSGAWDVWMDTPALLKPCKLWTGKQVFTAVLMHYTRDQLPFSLYQDSKVPADTWGKDSGEGNMHIWNNQLLAGIVDKAAFGKHGLLHIYHELYGAERTSIFTAALSRLFTGFLQMFGFTCGMSDVLLVHSANARRAELLDGADVRALDAAAQFVGVPSPLALTKEGLSPAEAYTQRERAVRMLLSERFRSYQDTGASLDMKVSGAMHPLSSEVVKACLPSGQVRAFRHNMMALMTVTGAKGSVVNFSQISCLLGQQELEGRRVPRMSSGKTLPCFAPYDSGARSGGFVGDRFLTGLRPQEYYFHCMAGREGLVDTTVKTSRSGYLQRCLMKNLESLKVAYDCTVRDDCDGSIVQFYYGEDGIDPMQTGMLRAFPFILYNMPQFTSQLEAGAALDFPRLPGQAEKEAQAQEAVMRRAKLMATPGMEESALNASAPPLNSQLLQTTLGVTSEGFQDALSDALFCGGMLPPPRGGPEEAYAALAKKARKRAKKGLPTSFGFLDPMDFQRAMYVKYYRCQVQPGEAVGVIAAQSVGEPSTQMTLNTFHMAGRGEANVTLGIPRLREILMTAAATIKTPVMTLPLRQGAGAGAAEELAVRLKRIRLAECLKSMSVEENAVTRTDAVPFGRGRVYRIQMQFHPPELYPPELRLRFEEISNAFTNGFVPKLAASVKTEMKRASTGGAKTLASVAASRQLGGEGEGAGAPPLLSEESAPKRAKRSEKDDWDDENREENEEFQEGKLRFAGGRGEQATYEAGDEEDARIQRRIARQEARREEEEEEGVADEEQEGEGQHQQQQDGSPGESLAGGKRGSKGAAGEGAVSQPGVDPLRFRCEALVTLPLDCPKLLIREMVERVCAQTHVRAVSGVTRSYILEEGRDGSRCLQTDGINIAGAWESQDLIDCDRLATNNPSAMLHAYGVEAARATILKEVRAVFGAYGIGVDPRHLSLIADYMTHLGGYRACNRLGIESSTSPFLKISFETAARFLVDATLHGDIDALTSPAARIVLGQPPRVGTGAIELVQKMDVRPVQLAA